MIDIQNHIGGGAVESLGDERQDVLNPATGECIATVPIGVAADVDRAVEAAQRAWKDWADTPALERSGCLSRLADLIDRNADPLPKRNNRISLAFVAALALEHCEAQKHQIVQSAGA